MTNDEEEVRKAYQQLVAAFGEGRLDDYFSCFAEDATFVFHGVPWLGSLREYRAEWRRLAEQEGFAVRGVETDVVAVQMFAGVAVLTHFIATQEHTTVGDETARERETIVFARQPDGRWLVVHEHLSPDLSA
jgi:uncharacterized protein (TIGR02246 family)